MEQDTETLSVNVGGFKFPVKVTASTKDLYIKAVERANNILASYKEKYPNRSSEWACTLTIMQLAVDLEDSLKKHDSKDSYTDGLASRVENFMASLDKKREE